MGNHTEFPPLDCSQNIMWAMAVPNMSSLPMLLIVGSLCHTCRQETGIVRMVPVQLVPGVVLLASRAFLGHG